MTVEPFATLQAAALKTSEVARRLGVARTTVYRWIERKEIPSFEVGGTHYVLIAAYERFAERHKKGAKRVTLEQQAARYIGEGVVVEGDVDPLIGLSFPAREASADVRGHMGGPPPLDDMLTQIRTYLDEWERQFSVASERVHREYLVERRAHVDGVPDDVARAWASCYAAYASLALIHAN